jgi:hypothetical protein
MGRTWSQKESRTELPLQAQPPSIAMQLLQQRGIRFSAIIPSSSRLVVKRANRRHARLICHPSSPLTFRFASFPFLSQGKSMRRLVAT